jgi:hypothetical protein
VTLPEAITAVRESGAELVLSPEGKPRLRGSVPPEVVAALRRDRDRVAAILSLRVVHRGMGFSLEDVLFIEDALLSGRISEIRIAARPPEGTPA